MGKMDFTKFPEFDNHELVVFAFDETSGLRSFIAIHNTVLGPAVGGTRYWHYGSEKEALRDALRLSKAMTYKCAIVGLRYGGGKGVIIANTYNPKKKKFLIAYAKKVNFLSGHFYTGEDVGLTTEHVNILAKNSRYIIGREHLAGNPSPWAALGVFYAIRAALEEVYGSAEMNGRKFAIKGIGKVGGTLLRLLYERGGKIVVADIDHRKTKMAKQHFPKIRVVSPNEIHRERVDVFAPCALGGDLNEETVPQLRCHIVCGGANNQLAAAEDGVRLQRAGILYVPDYVANAGGLINVVAELDPKGYSRKRVRNRVERIQKIAKKIIELSRKTKKPANEVADELAERVFKSRMRKR